MVACRVRVFIRVGIASLSAREFFPCRLMPASSSFGVLQVAICSPFMPKLRCGMLLSPIRIRSVLPRRRVRVNLICPFSRSVVFRSCGRSINCALVSWLRRTFQFVSFVSRIVRASVSRRSRLHVSPNSKGRGTGDSSPFPNETYYL